MKKIIIIGSSGAGKSTLAKNLGPILQIKIFHLDRLFWKSDWKRKTSYDRMELLEQLTLAKKQWIIEGNYLRSLGPGLMEADTIILLDLPPLICLWRIIKRHYKYYDLPRRDTPEGCTDRFTIRHILKVLIFPLHDLGMIEQTLRNYESKHIITLRSTKEVQAFLAQQERRVNDTGYNLYQERKASGN